MRRLFGGRDLYGDLNPFASLDADFQRLYGGAAAPAIISFTPTAQRSGATIVITGTDFTGATAVTIGGVAVASFVVDSATQITATIDSAIRSGTIAVTTAGGTATSSGTAYCLGVPALWLRAGIGLWQDTAGTVAANADTNAVARWDDKSAGAHNLTQATGASQPIVKLAQPPSGVTVVRFDGSNDYLFSSTGFLTGSSGSIFAAGKLGAGDVVLSSANTLADNNWCFARVTSQQINIQQRNEDPTDQVRGGTTISTSTWNVLEWHSSGTTYALAIDGVSETITVVSGNDTGDWFADAGTLNNVSLGCLLRTTAAAFLNGDMAETIVYDNVTLSGAEKTVVKTYLVAVLGA